MKENFLHYLWRVQRFAHQGLHTVDQQPIEIVQRGTHNHHAGPDFLNAKIHIGDTLWAGNVEMHLRASEWYAHGHQNDPAYDNVILHVVLENDRPVMDKNGQALPTLEIGSFIPPKLQSQYERLQQSEAWIPCQTHFHEVSEFTKHSWLDRLLVEKLAQKTSAVQEVLKATNNNWEETFYRMLARYFGVKVNTETFEMLARITPLNVLAKHKNNLLQLEAILFGQAGLLDSDFEEAYPKSLKKEYAFLRKKYQLTPMSATHWNFGRLRPASFPTVRIAQFAALVHRSSRLFSHILELEKPNSIEHLLSSEPSTYWETHYVFDKVSTQKKKPLGKTLMDLIIINTVVPVVFAYGQLNANADLKEKALAFLEISKPEKNSVIENWKNLGLKVENAHDSQALLQLKKAYCDQKRCVDCAIGAAILQKSTSA